VVVVVVEVEGEGMVDVVGVVKVDVVGVVKVDVVVLVVEGVVVVVVVGQGQQDLELVALQDRDRQALQATLCPLRLLRRLQVLGLGSAPLLVFRQAFGYQFHCLGFCLFEPCTSTFDF
jgi:hypothetical protein